MGSTDSFGYWLRRQRLARDLTQRQLADLVGCAPATVRKLEADERRPSPQLAERLADLLVIPPADRDAFLRAARGEGRVARLALPRHPAELPTPLGPATPHNLPAPPNDLIGRAADTAAIWAALQRPAARLICLTGPGGSGKTRLALQVAHELRDQFPGGVSFVDLAPVDDPARMLSAVLAALGLRERPDLDAHELLVAFLHGRRRLLLLDNFEQILTAAPRLAALLAALPELTLLVTSRFPLRIHAEHEYPVPPLTIPPPDDAPDTPPQLNAASVQLFIARAQAARPGLDLDRHRLRAIGAICRALDGLPLAIELAAAWVRTFPPEALLARLDQPLALLVGGPRDAPARQRTLRATIDWSYGLLDPAEQALFLRLGAFVGGLSLDAAEFVGSDLATAGRPARDLVAALVERHLVQARPGLGGEPRLSLLETLRAYVRERAAELGKLADACERHAAYFVGLGEQAEPHFHSFGSRRWMDRLEADLDNLRTALRWSLETPGRAGMGLRLIGSTWWYWELGGRRREAREWMAAILADPANAPPSQERAVALYGGAYMASQEHDYAGSDALITELEAIGRRLGDRRIEALGLLERGAGVRVVGDPAPWLAMLQRSLAIFQAIGDRFGITMATFEIGYVLAPPEAEVYLEESLRLARADGDTNVQTMSLFKLGGHALDRGDLDHAEALLEEARLVGSAGGDLRSTMHATGLLGFVALARGRLDQAEGILTELLEYARRLSELIELDHALGGLALIARWRGDAHAADRLAAEALTNPFVHSYPPRQAWLLGLRGILAEQGGDLAAAEALLRESLARYHAIGHAQGIAVALAHLGHLARRTGDPTGATAALRESVARFHALGRPGVATCLVGLAALAEDRGEAERAAILYAAAGALGAGSRPDLADCRPDDLPRIAAARARLSAPALASAWAAGAALTAAQAVAEALETIPR